MSKYDRSRRHFYSARQHLLPVRLILFSQWWSGGDAVGAVQCGAVQCGAVQCGAVQCGAVQCTGWVRESALTRPSP